MVMVMGSGRGSRIRVPYVILSRTSPRAKKTRQKKRFVSVVEPY